MKKNHKTVRKSFTYLQCDDFAAYLSKMAADGWHFKEWKSGLVFEKGEPEDAVYAVEVFINGSNYDMRPGEHTLSFAEYCEAAGWRLIDARAKYCIFKRLRDDAVDIVTQEERLENAIKAYRKNFYPQVWLAAMWLFQLFLAFYPVSDFIDTVFSGIDLFVSVCWFFYSIFTFSKLIWFQHWKKNAKKQLDTERLTVLSDAKETIWNWCSGVFAAMSILIFAIWADIWFAAFMIIFLALTLLFVLLLNKFRPDAATNFGITIIFIVVVLIAAIVTAIGSVDYSKGKDVPTDLMETVYNTSAEDVGTLQDTFYKTDSSVFGTKQRCHLTYENADFSYDLYETKHDWLLDLVWEQELSRVKNAAPADCTALWNANAAFKNSNGEYYVRYENTILILDLGEDRVLTEAQAAAVSSALGLG